MGQPQPRRQLCVLPSLVPSPLVPALEGPPPLPPLQLMYHVLGTPQSNDVTMLADPQNPTWMFGTECTHDGR